mmetsp:Transcript_9758/g.27930  ORF Transcript_9758/g.27930 Transcript_9758/m.27930 type:complete len:109 (-) Transcript_9758:54-380(-)
MDVVFPPLDLTEAALAEELIMAAVNTVAVLDLEELRELLGPWAVLKSLRDGDTLVGLQQLWATAGYPRSGPVYGEVLARMLDTYLSRLLGGSTAAALRGIHPWPQWQL